MSRAWKGGSTRQWRRIRAYVLARDTGLGCRAHREGWCSQAPGDHTCTDEQEVAHHTKGRAATGDDPRHIIAACRNCNQHIGDPRRHDPPGRSITRW
ncbi:MAG TPA: hypothetical protein VFR99_12735 [Marmoricola sp.]|nr:hypothetical protein [Marmoricola sp.]